MDDRDVRADAAAGGEGGDELEATGLENGDEVVEDAVGDVLVEDALVAEALEVHLQALQLNALLFGRVRECERAEIGLAGFGADRGEFGTDDFDDVIAAGKLVVEGFQEVAGIFWHGKWFRGVSDRLCWKMGLGARGSGR